MNIHVNGTFFAKQKRPDPKRDAVHGARYDATPAMAQLMMRIEHDRPAFVHRLRANLKGFAGGEILVGWHLVDRNFLNQGHDLHSLLDSDAPLPRTMVEVMLEFIGQSPEQF